MKVQTQRKRKLLQDTAPVPPGTTREAGLKTTTSVFILYDRESETDRGLAQRLCTTLQREENVKCSTLYDGNPGWVLKIYGEELEAADKVVALLSADFLNSDEGSFVFEMARSLCMEKRENKIIIASKSCRNLPKAYDGFPRVKMSKKSWVKDLLKEIKRPISQVSANTWTFNMEGYKAINFQELYRECEAKTSTSMPALACLEQPPSLPKSVVDRIMIWNRIRKGPKLSKALGRAESQRSQPTSAVQNITKIRKASSFSKDRETIEFVSTYCRTTRRSRRGRKSCSSTSPSSDILSTPRSSPFSKPELTDQSFPCRETLPPATDSQSWNHCKEVECDNSKPEANTKCEQDPGHRMGNSCCKKKRLTCSVQSSSESGTLKTSKEAINAHQAKFQIHCKDYSVMKRSSCNPKLADVIATFIKAMKHAGKERNITCDGQTHERSSKDTVSLDTTSNTNITVHCSETVFNSLAIQQATTQAPVATYASLPPEAVVKRPREPVEPVSNLDQIEFDNFLYEKPEDFCRVKFDYEKDGFVVHREDVVWLQSHSKTKTVSVRKRNGHTGVILRILLSPYTDCQWIDKS